jgi:hypothetical protein
LKNNIQLMKTFGQFLKEEVDLTGNKGIPSDFMSKSEEEARRSLGVRPDDERGEMPRIWPEFEQNMMQSNQLLRIDQNGRELNREQLEERIKSLEILAETIVREEFGDILDTAIKPIELNIKLVQQGSVSNQISDIRNVPQRAQQPTEEQQEEQDKRDEEKRKEEEENRTEEEKIQHAEQGEEVPGTNLALAIDKKKLLNMITQAAGKATKDIIRFSETVEQELTQIFGERQGKQILDCWVRMSDLADKMDWVIPINRKSEMMKNMPQGMAGACQVIWESHSGSEYNMSLLLEKEATKIIIKSVGIDFPMLIHETIKGIYLFLQSGAVKKDKEAAKIIKKATSSFMDEAQDFRYGPPALEMLVKFINKFPESNQYKRLDTRVFTILAYDKERAKDEAKESSPEFKQYLEKRADVCRTDDQFSEIMKSLFSTFDLEGPQFVLNEDKFNDSHAKDEISKIIKYIVDDIEDYKREIEEWEREQKERQEEESWKAQSQEIEPEEESDIDKLVRQSLSGEQPEPAQQKPYDQMTMVEIQQAIDDAVAEENYELAGELTNKYLKGEAKKVWENELLRINENLHIRRK